MVAVFKAVHTFVAMVGDAQHYTVKEHGGREEGSERPVEGGKQNSDMARRGRLQESKKRRAQQRCFAHFTS